MLFATSLFWSSEGRGNGEGWRSCNQVVGLGPSLMCSLVGLALFYKSFSYPMKDHSHSTKTSSYSAEALSQYIEALSNSMEAPSYSTKVLSDSMEALVYSMEAMRLNFSMKALSYSMEALSYSMEAWVTLRRPGVLNLLLFTLTWKHTDNYKD